jgi:hypothetical protein
MPPVSVSLPIFSVPPVKKLNPDRISKMLANKPGPPGAAAGA